MNKEKIENILSEEQQLPTETSSLQPINIQYYPPNVVPISGNLKGTLMAALDQDGKAIALAWVPNA